MDKITDTNLNNKVGDKVQDNGINEPQLTQKLNEVTVTQMKEIEVQKVFNLLLVYTLQMSFRKGYKNIKFVTVKKFNYH